ncbi:SNF2 family N-terminal domain-containing protein, partial [Globomyces pollinis-pini]
TLQDFNVLHPDLVDVWDRLANEPLYDLSNKQTPEQLLVTLLPFQLQGLSWLQQQEKSRFKGGILADEMGMGKTIQMISLLVSKRVRRTLILCPTVAMNQWKNELMNRTLFAPWYRNCLFIVGPSRTTSQAELEKYDVVLTSYAILESGYRKQMYGTKEKGELVKRKSLLHKIHWGRIVLDEAHAIKDRSSSTAKAAFALQRDFQWSLSGTPLQNRVGELYSLIRLLNIYPYSFYFCRSCDCRLKEWHFSDRTYCDGCGHTTHQHFCWWNKEILKPIQDSGTEGNGLGAFKKLNTLLDRIMLRRTKVEKNDELGLPPRIVVSRRDYFNDAEEELYESLYTETTRTFNTYVQSGTVLNHYASIFSLLSRMRLAANHPELVTAKLAMKDSKFVCVVCHEEAEDPIASKCKHVFCREDAMQYLESVPDHEPINCPKCFHSLSIDLTQPAMDISDKKTMENQMSIVNQVDLKNWRSSTKIEALVEELNKLKMEDCTIKSIVFSQFTSFLDLVHWRLSRGGFNVVKLDGRMGPTQRANVIEKFTKDPTVTVFLISLKAGGIALNLTEASQVFVMDPWWNPAVEDQAMDRIHRLGQHRPIKITRMIIENSIESRILELQQKKKALFDSTVGKKLDSLSKLSQDDLRFLFVL